MRPPFRTLHSVAVLLALVAAVMASSSKWNSARFDAGGMNFLRMSRINTNDSSVSFGAGWNFTSAHGTFTRPSSLGYLHGVLLYHNTTSLVRFILVSESDLTLQYDEVLNMTVKPKGVDGSVWPSLAEGGGYSLAVCGASLNQSRSLCQLFDLERMQFVSELGLDGSHISAVASYPRSGDRPFIVVAGTRAYYMWGDDDFDEPLQFSGEVADTEQQWDQLFVGDEYQFVTYYMEEANSWAGSVIRGGGRRGFVLMNQRYATNFVDGNAEVDPQTIQGCLARVNPNGMAIGESCYTPPLRDSVLHILGCSGWRRVLFTSQSAMAIYDDDDEWVVPYTDPGSDVPLTCYHKDESSAVYVDGDTILMRRFSGGDIRWKRPLESNVDPAVLWCVTNAILVGSDEDEAVLYRFAYG